MKRIGSLLGVLALLCSTSTSVMAINMLQYTQSIQTSNIDPQTLSSILTISQTCGNPNDIYDQCQLQGYTQLANSGNSVAASLLNVYNQALNEGQVSSQQACHTDDFIQANRIIAHCNLLLNIAALNQQDPTSASQQNTMCIQGGMQALIYQNGNIAAQYILDQFYKQKGMTDTANVWKNALDMRKESQPDAFNLVVQCYGQ